jgi:hypothetical protein
MAKLSQEQLDYLLQCKNYITQTKGYTIKHDLPKLFNKKYPEAKFTIDSLKGQLKRLNVRTFE